MKYPSYLNLSKNEWQKRIKKALLLLKSCCVCPRKCGVDRLQNKKGFCRAGRLAIISSAHPHFGEEKCLVGENGSGTIFMTFCNLRCVYCQNYDISQLGEGDEISKEKLAQIMINLQKLGCHNINFVSPTHQVPQILEALPIAIENGLKIPLVYNSNGYDSAKTLKLLDGIFDIYMPDTKYSDNDLSLKYSSAPCYFKIMKLAIKEMFRQVGDLIIENEIAEKGLLVRHLVLPQDIAGSEKIMKFLSNLSKNTFVNIMDQYRPCFMAVKFPEINRGITQKEYQKAIKIAQNYRLKRIYS